MDWFYRIQFHVRDDHSAEIIVDDGNGHDLISKRIEGVDFPPQGEAIHFYLCDTEGGYCLMLPSEY